MRILQIAKFPEDFGGGIETAVFNLSKYVAKTNKVVVVTSNVNRKHKQIKYKNFICYSLPTWFILFSTPITPSLIPYLIKHGSEFDVIQISLPNPMAVIAYLIAKPKGKLIVWYHSDVVRPFILSTLFMPLLLNMLKKASVIVAASNNYIRTSPLLKKFYNKTIVIPYGINLENFTVKEGKYELTKLRELFGAPLVLFIGRLVYYKGLTYLIKSMKALDAKLVIIGRGPLENRLKALVKKNELTKRIFFQKVPSNDQIAKYIHACDAVVLPSIHRSEAFGIVLLEAMACGKPVITTELGTGTSFVCQDGVTGLVVPPKDSLGLKNAINKVLHNPELAKKLGETGRKRVEEHFTIENVGEAFLRLYTSVTTVSFMR